MGAVIGATPIEIAAEVMGKPSAVYPTLIWDGARAMLVDAGYPGQTALIREAIEKAGVPFARLEAVILTHHDMDHIGSLASLVQERGGKVQVLAHELEAPYIDGRKRPLKLEQLEARYDTLSAPMKALCEGLRAGFEKARTPVTRTLQDGEVLPWCGGIEVIHVPGHTHGHICLYLRESKTLITGDAFFLEGGQLVPAPQFANNDNAQALRSLAKLTRYDVETAICYHGGVYTQDVNRRIAELAGA